MGNEAEVSNLSFLIFRAGTEGPASSAPTATRPRQPCGGGTTRGNLFATLAGSTISYIKWAFTLAQQSLSHSNCSNLCLASSRWASVPQGYLIGLYFFQHLRREGFWQMYQGQDPSFVRTIPFRKSDQVCCCLQVNRPAAMKKEGIQTRKRKPKSGSSTKEPKQKHSNFSGERSSKHQQVGDLYSLGKMKVFLGCPSRGSILGCFCFRWFFFPKQCLYSASASTSQLTTAPLKRTVYLIFVCGHRPKTKVLLELLFFLLYTIWFISTLKGI